eukprot:m.1389 g.1389  ORF g.1389 m.1389 type:complete len:57 (-) comp1507_c0_seq1:76-246(-)
MIDVKGGIQFGVCDGMFEVPTYYTNGNVKLRGIGLCVVRLYTYACVSGRATVSHLI